MLRRVTSDEGREVVVHKGKRDCSGSLFRIPCQEGSGHTLPDSPGQPRMDPRQREQAQGEGEVLSAPGAGNRLYFAPGITRSI